MGWVSNQVRPTRDIFNDLVKVFGKKWKNSYLPSGNGSPYEYFSDYIKDYYEVTLSQCDTLCRMIKGYYDIKLFYYYEIEAARKAAKKRHWIEITENNSFHHDFGDGTAIFGVDPAPKTLRLSLNDNEYKALEIGLCNNGEGRQDLALCYFVRTFCISDWHKRVIRRTFKGDLGEITIKIV